MYGSCLHCHGALGANQRFDRMPVGRRLAFDPARGRLWVVCGRCRRWNLTPLEERWEVVEECERAFRGTRLRTSTANVGLARLADGVELVRVGSPQRPEMAAWRYGVTLLRRRRRALVPAVAVTAAGIGGNALLASGVIGIGATMVGVVGGFAVLAASMRRTWNPWVVADGRSRRLRTRESESARLAPAGEGWELRWDARGERTAVGGTDAERSLRSILAAANVRGGAEADVSGAASLLDAVGSPAAFITRLARAAARHDARGILVLPPDVRLGLEMALHDDTERRALSGELAALEDEWRAAEEIAGIADGLLVPDAVASRLSGIRDGGDEHARRAVTS